MYPDYDFSQLRAQHFEKELNVTLVEEAVDSHLLEVSRVSCIRLPELWETSMICCTQQLGFSPYRSRNLKLSLEV